MLTVAFYTGQAVVGNMNNFSFYTGQFSTCSPVVLYNSQTNVGGMFHLPGKNGTRSELLVEWQSYIQPMIELIKPTDVWVFRSGGGSTADREELAGMFNDYTTTHNASFTIHRDNTPRSGIYVSLANGMPQFSVMRSFDDPIYDARHKKPPPSGCTLLNPDINVSNWIAIDD
ncbi:MAG TPA: hypothetical protein VN706_03000 [Gemmatimonadaceae bacterium]|nr:hypothetical protein [Gemmatimonadaceae bacterium]